MDFTTAVCNQMGFGGLGCLLIRIMVFIDAIVVPFIMAIAFVVFLWGVFQYFIAGGADEEKRTQGRNFVMWSLIGFVIIMSLWGIVNLLMNSLGFQRGTRPPLPLFNGTQAAQQGSVNPSSNPFNSSPARVAPSQQNQNAAGTKQQGWVCTADSECISGSCEVYVAAGDENNDVGQRRCL